MLNVVVHKVTTGLQRDKHHIMGTYSLISELDKDLLSSFRFPLFDHWFMHLCIPVQQIFKPKHLNLLILFSLFQDFTHNLCHIF
jgi:hypothetical protein